MVRPGDKIGPYILVEELGRGGFGVVWLAERRGSLATTQVAIKIPLEVEPDLEALAREAGIWVRASGHPNVLPVIEADVYDGQVAIVSEYAAGGSLAGWLKQQRGKSSNLEAVREMTLGILAGLSHLHSRGIIHRDLKPANILLQGEIPRLTDFGLARVLKASGHSHGVGGTPSYMAPEAWDGHRTESSDLWSVGVILYEMVAGKKPFPQTDLMPLFRAISRAEPTSLPSTVPDRFVRLLERSLEKEPEKRYGSALEMLAELRSWAPTEETQDAPQAARKNHDNLVHQLWNNLESDLQDALSLAFNQARREGKDRISTRTFFAAVARLKPGRLSRLLGQFPEGSLPDPIARDVPVDRRILKETPLLSTCVENSLVNLAERASPDHKLATEDVFVDVAKYGTGASVAQLRAHGLTPEQIDRIVGQLGWRVARRPQS